jgi:hypothetical protein
VEKELNPDICSLVFDCNEKNEEKKRKYMISSSINLNIKLIFFP